jgi:hypothetical protein
MKRSAGVAQQQSAGRPARRSQVRRLAPQTSPAPRSSSEKVALARLAAIDNSLRTILVALKSIDQRLANARGDRQALANIEAHLAGLKRRLR